MDADHSADPTADRERKHAAERDALYRAGWTVLRRNGYANAGITEILSESGLGTRAFYRHFDSKDELLVSMFRDSAEATSTALASRIARAGSPLDRLLAWIDEILAMGNDPRHSEIARMFTSPAMRAVFMDVGDGAIAALRTPLLDALVDGTTSGDFAECDPEVDASTIHAIVWQLFTDTIHDRCTLDAAASRAHVERFVLRAIGAR